MLKYLFAKSLDHGFLDVPEEAVCFTYHKRSAIKALLAGFLLAAFVEATAIHLLIAQWSHWIAWIATLSTIWVAFQIMAQIRAVGLRPIYLQGCKLVLRNGAFDLAEIPVDQIDGVEISNKEIKVNDGDLKPFNMGFPASHNVVINLKEPLEGKVLNRSKRKFQIALLAIDDAEEFSVQIDSLIGENE